MKKDYIAMALPGLGHESGWCVRGGVIEWLEDAPPENERPTQAQINAEIKRILRAEKIAEAKTYMTAQIAAIVPAENQTRLIAYALRLERKVRKGRLTEAEADAILDPLEVLQDATEAWRDSYKAFRSHLDTLTDEQAAAVDVEAWAGWPAT